MPTTTYQLTTIGHALDVGMKLPRSWFRGHETICGELTPKIYRSVYDEMWRNARWFECRLIKDFMRLVVPMMTDAPRLDQKIRWIVLMQHYGAPTKLLDWTQSVRTGLYPRGQCECDHVIQ